MWKTSVQNTSDWPGVLDTHDPVLILAPEVYVKAVFTTYSKLDVPFYLFIYPSPEALLCVSGALIYISKAMEK